MDVLPDQAAAVVGLFSRMKYSIVIPTLDEEETLISNLEYLHALELKLEAEIIIVDGKSKDNTKEVAKSLTSKVFDSNSSRSLQFNKGVLHAQGEYYIFLHADTKLDDNAENSLQIICDNFQWGFFKIKLDHKDLKYSFLSFCINLRSRLFRYCTGDQVLIIKSSLFHKLKGYKEIELMEDIDISNRLKKISDPTILPGQAITSCRRWKKYGFFKTILLMRFIRLLYFLGISTNILRRIYR